MLLREYRCWRAAENGQREKIAFRNAVTPAPRPFFVSPKSEVSGQVDDEQLDESQPP
jgi:hypothetical protein